MVTFAFLIYFQSLVSDPSTIDDILCSGTALQTFLDLPHMTANLSVLSGILCLRNASSVVQVVGRCDCSGH